MPSETQPPVVATAAPGAAPETLAQCLAPEEPAVLSVALLDKVVGALVALGVPPRRRTIVRRLNVGFVLLTLVVGALGYVHGGRPGLANLNALILLLFIHMMMRSARLTWRAFRGLAASLDAIVADEGERRRVAEAMARKLRWRPQLVLAVATLIVGGVLGAFIGRSMGSSSIANWLFAPIDAVAVVLGANVIYWLWVAVVWLSRFSRLKSIELAIDPETDPALVGSLKMIRDVRLRVLAGLLVAELPPLVLLIATHGGLLPLVACGVVLALCLVTGVAIGVLPVVYIGRVRRTDRNNTIARLGVCYEEACVGASPAVRLELARTYHQAKNEIRRRSVYPLNAESLGLITATVVGPAVPFLLAIIFSVKPGG